MLENFDASFKVVDASIFEEVLPGTLYRIIGTLELSEINL